MISGHAGVHTLPIPSSHHGHSPGSSPTGSSQHSPTGGDKRQRASSVEADPGKIRVSEVCTILSLMNVLSDILLSQYYLLYMMP